MCSWRNRPQMKAGGSNVQISAQVCDAGNVPDGADRYALVHSGFCDGRWRRWRPFFFFHYLPGPFLPAFVVPEAVGHQSHPQDQEDRQAVQRSTTQHLAKVTAQPMQRATTATIMPRLSSSWRHCHDDHPSVANLIGYSDRRLGDYCLLPKRWSQTRVTTAMSFGMRLRQRHHALHSVEVKPD
jgi:hypothetical protein